MNLWLKAFGPTVLLAVLFLGWLHFVHDPSVRATVRAESGADSLQARGDSIHHADSLTIAAYRDSAARITTRIVVIHQRADSVTPAFRARLADSLKAGFDSVTSVYVEENRQLRALVHLDSLALAAKDVSIEALHSTLHETADRLTAALKRSGPKLRCGPAVGAGIGLSGGATVFAGVACVL